jgi:hypothetical protein
VAHEAFSEGAGQEAASRSFEGLARCGMLVRGVVFGLIAVLAILVAAGVGGTTTDQKGALQVVAGAPLGRTLVVLLAIGLGGYALWQLAQGFLNTEGHGHDAKGWLERVGAVGIGVAYGILCAAAVQVLIGSGGSSSGDEAKATGGVLGWPGGRALVVVAGLVVIGVGGYGIYRAVTAEFMERMRVAGRTRDVVEWLGRVGYAAQGAVFVLIGVFLVKAAVEFDPTEAVGLDGALGRVSRGPAGPYLLGAVAAGLLAYAAFCVAEARYREVPTGISDRPSARRAALRTG